MSPFHDHSSELTLDLAADPRRAWVALTEEMGDWWSPDMTAAGGRMDIEAHVGGRLFETTADGGGILWATVALIVPGKKIECFGELAPPFGGPARTWHAFEISAGPASGSVLTFRDHVWGAIDPSLGATLIEGWRGILGGLQRHLAG